jgi:hypothetical protein
MRRAKAWMAGSRGKTRRSGRMPTCHVPTRRPSRQTRRPSRQTRRRRCRTLASPRRRRDRAAAAAAPQRARTQARGSRSRWRSPPSPSHGAAPRAREDGASARRSVALRKRRPTTAGSEERRRRPSRRRRRSPRCASRPSRSATDEAHVTLEEMRRDHSARRGFFPRGIARGRARAPRVSPTRRHGDTVGWGARAPARGTRPS